MNLKERNHHRLCIWNDRKVIEMDTSCFNTWVIWDFPTIRSTCVSGTLPKSCLFFYLRVQVTVVWSMLQTDVLDMASESLGIGAGGRDEALGKKRGMLYWKSFQKLSVRVVSWGTETQDFLTAQWQDPIQREQRTSAAGEQILRGLKWFISV